MSNNRAVTNNLLLLLSLLAFAAPAQANQRTEGGSSRGLEAPFFPAARGSKPGTGQLAHHLRVFR
jgi:hypothetical protein